VGFLGANSAAFAQTKAPAKAPVVSAASYRATLQKALDELQAMEKRPPRRLGPLLKRLDTPFIVRRADGQTQAVSGNVWSKMALGSSPANATGHNVVKARQLAEFQIRALDEWTKTPATCPPMPENYGGAGKVGRNSHRPALVAKSRRRRAKKHCRRFCRADEVAE
jgi:hypothetical protein